MKLKQMYRGTHVVLENSSQQKQLYTWLIHKRGRHFRAAKANLRMQLCTLLRIGKQNSDSNFNTLFKVYRTSVHSL